MNLVVKYQCGVMSKYHSLLQSKEPVDAVVYLVLMGMGVKFISVSFGAKDRD